MDVPDLTILSVPHASMGNVGSENHLFPSEAQVEAVHQIKKVLNGLAVLIISVFTIP